jgi:erythritol/L-threitol dehydrogenase
VHSEETTMSDTMMAVRTYSPKDYRLERVPVPTIGQEEVLLKIDAAGICGSDGKCFDGAPAFWDKWVQAPVIPGHEFFGTVVKLGPGAAEKFGLQLGDKAIAEQIYPCDRCRYCTRGQYWMCEIHDMYGFQKHVNGAWAEYMRLGPNSRIHKMPADISKEAGVLIEPLACAIHAVERGEIQLGDTVTLAGAGTLGLLMLQIIKLKNPGQIIVTDAKEERLEMARSLGADVTINVKATDPVAKVKSLTDGYGTDVFIEASGYAPAVAQGLDMLRKLGTFVSFGVFGEKTTADWSIIGDRKELTIHGAHLGPYCYPKAIDYAYRGVVKADAIVTNHLSLSDFAQGIERVLAGKGVKHMLVPGA